MSDFQTTVAIAAAALAGLIVVALVASRAWHEWLELQRMALAGRRGPDGAPPASARIELADLRERVRKLEAIAAGVDL